MIENPENIMVTFLDKSPLLSHVLKVKLGYSGTKQHSFIKSSVNIAQHRELRKKLKHFINTTVEQANK